MKEKISEKNSVQFQINGKIVNTITFRFALPPRLHNLPGVHGGGRTAGAGGVQEEARDDRQPGAGSVWRSFVDGGCVYFPTKIGKFTIFVFFGLICSSSVAE